MPAVPQASYVVVALVLLAPVVAGPGGTPTELGDGTADVAIISPTDERLSVEPGRFGTAAPYLRLPDLVVDVSNLTGRPRALYAVEVPALDVDQTETRLIRDEGRLTIHMPDRAFQPPADSPSVMPNGTVEGRLIVRVQSFSSGRIHLNRTVTVRERR
jgi:hypothetical protein